MLPSFQTTFDKLTPGQQTMAQTQMEEWNNELASDKIGGQPVTTDGSIQVNPALKVVFLVPGIASPVDLGVNGGNLQQGLVFSDLTVPTPAKTGAGKPPSAPTPEALATMMAALARMSDDRAVLVHPRSAAGVDADIAAMKRLGLNQMWLDVFSDGAVHIPGSPLSALPHPLRPGENAILTEAIAKGKGAGVAVYAVIDPFYWGDSPPAELTDLNIFGETSSQEEARWNQLKDLLPPDERMSEMYENGGIVPGFHGIAVAPTQPAVRSALLGIARLVAQRAGVAGIVLRDSDPPGYDLEPGTQDRSVDLQLGFVEPARLAFLRKYHADPIDLYASGGYNGIANTNLPNFSDINGWTGQLTNDLWTKWAKFRREANLQLLDDIYNAAAGSFPAQPAQSRFTVIVKQRRYSEWDTDASGKTTAGMGWYASWDTVSKAPPTVRGIEEDIPGAPSQNAAPADIQAVEQSHHVYMAISRDKLNQFAVGLMPIVAKYAEAAPTSGASAGSADPHGPNITLRFGQKTGYVLDLSDDPFGDDGNGSDPLTSLISQMDTDPAISNPVAP